MAHVIRAKPGAHAGFGWHKHNLDFQMYYVLRGWVTFDYEGVGEVTSEAGSCVHQPPGSATPKWRIRTISGSSRSPSRRVRDRRDRGTRRSRQDGAGHGRLSAWVKA